MKPVIGITGNRLVKGVDVFYGHRVTYTQQRYVDAIQKSWRISYRFTNR